MKLNLRSPESRAILDDKIAEKELFMEELQARGFEPYYGHWEPTPEEYAAYQERKQRLREKLASAAHAPFGWLTRQTFHKGAVGVRIKMYHHERRPFAYICWLDFKGSTRARQYRSMGELFLALDMAECIEGEAGK